MKAECADKILKLEADLKELKQSVAILSIFKTKN